VRSGLVDRFPDAIVGLAYGRRFGEPEVMAHVFATGTTRCADSILIDFMTGALLVGDTGCSTP
jgi:hypothetical protein